jgi:GNAT superfamily N-acetyltransferase
MPPSGERPNATRPRWAEPVSEWAIEPLSGHHLRNEFTCGEASLDAWLQRQAGQYKRRDLARVYVAVRPGEARVWGYYALSCGQIRYEDLPEDRSKGLPRRLGIPVALIGQLAVDVGVQGQGLGDILLIDALRRIQGLSQEIGIRAVVVDAASDRALAYWLHKGFEALVDCPNRLFMPLEIVRQLGFDA